MNDDLTKMFKLMSEAKELNRKLGLDTGGTIENMIRGIVLKLELLSEEQSNAN